MTKEEILNKSRNENKNQDLYDSETQKTAAKMAVYSGVIICLVINVITAVFLKKACYEALMMLCGMEGALFWVKFAKIHKKHELFVSLLYTLGFLASTIYWIISLR